jgi:DNA-binding transcriptional regulator YdaS (Cro superfamily)
MDLTKWLDAEPGRNAKLAAHLKRTPAAITQWRKNGVPVDLMKAVRDFTNGEVTLEEMVPDASPQEQGV